MFERFCAGKNNYSVAFTVTICVVMLIVVGAVFTLAASFTLAQ